jgi:hypothetical protein
MSSKASRASFKVNLDPVIESVQQARALVFVRETASSRLMRRLRALGILRPDAARLVTTKDNCALLDEAIDEATRTEPINVRLSRLEQVKSYSPPPGFKLEMPDRFFRVSNRQAVTSRCDAEIRTDIAGDETVAYGPALLMNQLDGAGHVSGPVIFVADIGEHNEALRRRFADRVWYRLELPGGVGGVPRLVPYR